MMNKRGFFIPLFVFATFVMLTLLTYAILSTNANRNDVIGSAAVSLIKIYDEGEKVMIYLDKSSKLDKMNAMRILGENGGFMSSLD